MRGWPDTSRTPVLFRRRRRCAHDRGADGDRGGIACQRGDAVAEELADHDAEEAADDGDEDRLGEELEKDLRRRRADRFARPHFAHALVERRQLDVHDHDAADEQRDDPADHEGHVVHLVVLFVAAQVGDAREDFEILRAVLAEEDGFDLVDRLLVALHVLHAHVHEAHFAALERLALARHERRQRDVDLAVHPAHHVALVIEAEVLLLHHADDQVAGAVDGHGLADRIVAAEELLRRAPCRGPRRARRWRGRCR